MRLLMTTASREKASSITADVTEPAANYLNNRKRKEISNLEDQYNVEIRINVWTDVGPEHVSLRCFDEIGSEIKNITPVRSKN